MREIILASMSPRRRELLKELGVAFSVMPTNADESCDIRDPREYVCELARRKGQEAYRLLCEQRGKSAAEGTVILSADTSVVCDEEILGKPLNETDARRMLKMLSGKTHYVMTGVGVTLNGETTTDCSITEVRVDPMTDEDIEAYIATGEPMDKAGAYGIQGRFSRHISGINGCYFGVVGLPLHCLCELYQKTVGEVLGKDLP